MLSLPAGARIDGERAGAPGGAPGAEPRIARPPHPLLFSRRSGAGRPQPSPARCALRPAPEGGLLSQISAPAPGIPAARLRLGGGDGDPPGENQLRASETRVLQHRLRSPGRGGCQGTWKVSASREAASPPSTPDAVRPRGNGRRTGKPGLWPIIYPVSPPGLPSLSEVGAGIIQRWLCGWGRGSSGEIGGPRMRSRQRRRPAHLPLPPSLATARGSSVQDTGGSARPRAAGDHCPGLGARGAGHTGVPTSSRPPRKLRHTLQRWQGTQWEPRIKALWLGLPAPSPGVQLGAPRWSAFS